MDEKLYTLGFSAFVGIGTKRFEKLIATFGSAEKAWCGLRSDLKKVLGNALGEKFAVFRNDFNVETYAKEIQKKEIQFFVPTDTAYPKLLKKLEHPPYILFAKGNVWLLQSDKTIAIVGTRKVTSYGVQVTEMLTRELVANNFTIVSGMALGVDGIAHKETIKHNGATIAVLGSGVDVPTPREHEKLYKEILENNGLILSTFSPGEDAHIGSFPARNAIVAGVSLGVVVTEGAADSGALITANYAKKLGRPIFAVPGQITSHLSKGTNNLIKQGATVILTARDIMDHLGYQTSPQPSPKKAREIEGKFSAQEQKIISLLESGPLHFDEIARTIGKDSKATGAVLSMMELKGMIKTNGTGEYSINF